MSTYKQFITSLKKYITGHFYRKLALITTIIVASAIVLISVYATWAITNVFEETTHIEHQTKLQIISQNIESLFSVIKREMIYLSHSQPLTRYLMAKREMSESHSDKRIDLEEDLRVFLNAHQIYTQIQFVDEMGQEIIHIESLGHGTSVIIDEAEMQNQINQTYFIEAIRLLPGQVYISPLQTYQNHAQPSSANKSEPLVCLSMPVFLGERLAGVIVVYISLDSIHELLQKQQTNFLLIDQDGYYLSYVDDEQAEIGYLIDDYSEYIVQNILSNQPETIIAEGQSYIHQPIALPTDNETKWHITLIQSRFAMPELSYLLSISIILIIVVSLGAGLFTIQIGKIITKPITELNQVTLQFASGDLEARIEPSSDDEIGSLATRFNTMADKIKNFVDTLEHHVQERTRTLGTSAIISNKLNTMVANDELLQEIVSTIQNVFGYYHVHIYLIDEKSGYLVMREGSGEIGQKLKAKGHQLVLGRGIVGSVAETGEAFCANNVLETFSFFPNPLLPKTKSELAVPIKKGDKVLGVLDMQSDRLAGFTPEDLTLMQSIADQVAVVIDNARLFQSMHAALDEVESLNRKLTRQSWSNIGEKTKVTNYVFSNGEISPSVGDWSPVMEQAVLQKQLIQQNGEYQVDEQSSKSLAIPLILRDEIVGVISIEVPPSREWSEDELITVQSISDQVALAIDTARLARETEQRAAREEIIASMTQSVWAAIIPNRKQ
ncbi:MAG: hypothetical protein B6242_13725 [Anaerolineaceae bacterium 4572_78]|nr:MAG: hypothetical protein B6242_13725 [Anaerolineaceae bacterium 4572_78]